MPFKTKTLGILFITVLIDLMGFGMIIPIIPFLARKLEASPFEVGLLLTFYAGFQFLLAPLWGKVSDHLGRKPVLIIGLFGTGLAHFWFSYSTDLFTLILARIFAGIFGATVSTALAVIGDVTGKSKRSQGMGLIGAAFGLGFVIGPFAGSLFAMLGSAISSKPPFGENFVAFVAGIIALLNCVFVYLFFEETLRNRKSRSLKKNNPSHSVLNTNPPEKRTQKLKWPSLLRKNALRRNAFCKMNQIFSPRGGLILIFFLYSLSMSQLETCLFLFLDDVFQWDVKKASLGFAYMGFLMLITHTYFLSRLIPLLGESKLLGTGIFLSLIGYMGIALITVNTLHLGIAVSLIGIGSALMQSLLRGSVSVLTSNKNQGITLGILHSLASLGRMIGPLIAGLLYHSHYSLPFWASSGFLLIAYLFYLILKNKIPSPGHQSKT